MKLGISHGHALIETLTAQIILLSRSQIWSASVPMISCGLNPQRLEGKLSIFSQCKTHIIYHVESCRDTQKSTDTHTHIHMVSSTYALVKIPMLPAIVGCLACYHLSPTQDGGAFPPGVLLEERIPSEEDVAKAAPFGTRCLDLRRVLIFETGDWALNLFPFRERK